LKHKIRDAQGGLSASHPVRVRGLKPAQSARHHPRGASHPVRVRGLKHTYLMEWEPTIGSHPVRVRGLKLAGIRTKHKGLLRRTPCGCVG